LIALLDEQCEEIINEESPHVRNDFNIDNKEDAIKPKPAFALSCSER